MKGRGGKERKIICISAAASWNIKYQWVAVGPVFQKYSYSTGGKVDHLCMRNDTNKLRALETPPVPEVAAPAAGTGPKETCLFCLVKFTMVHIIFDG